MLEVIETCVVVGGSLARDLHSLRDERRDTLRELLDTVEVSAGHRDSLREDVAVGYPLIVTVRVVATVVVLRHI